MKCCTAVVSLIYACFMQNDSAKGYLEGRTSKNIHFFEIYVKFRHEIMYMTIFGEDFVFRSECRRKRRRFKSAELFCKRVS